MVIYMKGRRKIQWRHHLFGLGLLLLFVLVNKFLFSSWSGPDPDTGQYDVPFLPADTDGTKHTPHQQHTDKGNIDPDKVLKLNMDNLVDTFKPIKEVLKQNRLIKPRIQKDAVEVAGVNSGPVDEALHDYTLYLQDTKESDIQDEFVNKHNYRFTLNNKYACNGNVFVVTLVHSAPQNRAARQMIRASWGAVRFYSGAVIVQMFLLAQIDKNDQTLQEDIKKESNTYRDIVQGNFIDSYKNLTYKNVMGLHWVNTFCNRTKFVLKTDDDTMVNIYHMTKFLFQKSPDGNFNNFLYCSTYKNHGPRRDKSDKWFVSLTDYKYAKYPPYCEGFAYIMSTDVSKRLYDASQTVKPYWIDDVFVTGFLALKAGIYHKDMERGHGYNLMKSEHISKTVQSNMFILAKYDHLKKNWNKTWSDIKTVHRIVD